MTVQEFINWMQKEIEINPNVANYDLTAGDEIEYIVGSYEIDITHLQKKVRL